jgi:hypothetical protein
MVFMVYFGPKLGFPFASTVRAVSAQPGGRCVHGSRFEAQPQKKVPITSATGVKSSTKVIS